MTFKFDTAFKLELAFRLLLWTLFLFLDRMEPFERVIQPEELWKYKYPDMDSYVTTQKLWLLVFGVPIVLIVHDHVKKRDRYETCQAVLSLSLNYGITGVLTTLFKNVVGRPRPNFYFRCFPNGHGNPELNCTGPRLRVLDARKSFPSGHSSFAFASMVFVSLYLSDRLRLFSKGRGHTWRMLLVFIPLLIAALIAISRTCDYHHHVEDIIAGSLLGTAIAIFCYKQYYPIKNTTFTGNALSAPSSISTAYAGRDVSIETVQVK